MYGDSPDDGGKDGIELDNSISIQQEATLGGCHLQAKIAGRQVGEALLLNSKLDSKLVNYLASDPSGAQEDIPKDLVDMLSKHNAMGELGGWPPATGSPSAMPGELGVHFGNLSDCFQFKA